MRSFFSTPSPALIELRKDVDTRAEMLLTTYDVDSKGFLTMEEFGKLKVRLYMCLRLLSVLPRPSTGVRIPPPNSHLPNEIRTALR